MSENVLIHLQVAKDLNTTHFTFTTVGLHKIARHAGSDGSMSASGSAGPGFDSRRGSKFSFENFQPRS